MRQLEEALWDRPCRRRSEETRLPTPMRQPAEGFGSVTLAGGRTGKNHAAHAVGAVGRKCGLVTLVAGQPGERRTTYADEEAGGRIRGLLGLDWGLPQGVFCQGTEGVVGEHICVRTKLG